MSSDLAPGWYPEADEAYQRWWDGTTWTEHRRASRFPGFVERGGRPVFRGRNLWPAGPGEFATAVRRTQALGLSALLLLVVGFPVVIVGSILMADGEMSVAPLVVLSVVVVVLLLLTFVPAITIYRIGRRVREAHARGEFYAPVGPDGVPVSRPGAEPGR